MSLSLPGVTEAPHFDRTAFRVRTIFASLPAEGDTANLRLTPDQQEHWCALLPDALAPVPNKWGAKGWTRLRLSEIGAGDLGLLLRLAWSNCGGRAGADTTRTRKTIRKVKG